MSPTLQQQAYYHAVVIPVAARALNVTAEDAHRTIKLAFLGQAIDHATGELLPDPPSTTTLNVSQFADYLDQVISYLTERGYAVPQPDQRRTA